MAKHKVINAWQAKQKVKGRVTLTVFLDKKIKIKIFARAKAKGMSVAEYLNRYLPTMWNKKEVQPKPPVVTSKYIPKDDIHSPVKNIVIKVNPTHVNERKGYEPQPD
jgi:hypothetical protein